MRNICKCIRICSYAFAYMTVHICSCTCMYVFVRPSICACRYVLVCLRKSICSYVLVRARMVLCGRVKSVHVCSWASAYIFLCFTVYVQARLFSGGPRWYLCVLVCALYGSCIYVYMYISNYDSYIEILLCALVYLNK